MADPVLSEDRKPPDKPPNTRRRNSAGESTAECGVAKKCNQNTEPIKSMYNNSNRSIVKKTTMADDTIRVTKKVTFDEELHQRSYLVY